MPATLVHDITAIAQRTPAAPAVSWHDTTWTYEELERALRGVAGLLRGRGVVAGDRVALLLRNSPQYAACYLGTLAAGAAAVPLNVQERANVLERQIAHCGAALVFADQSHLEFTTLAAALAARGVQLVALDLRGDGAACHAFAAALAQPGDAAAADLQLEAADDALACIIYTSGTTGRPKGVMLSHGNLAANARSIAAYLGIESRDKVLCPLPFHFSYGCSVLNSNLASGAHVLIEDNLAFPQMLVKRLQDEGITAFAGVPSTFALLLGRTRLGDFDLSKLRCVTQAGGAMPRAQIEQLVRALPHTRVFIMYGQTEATARLTYLPPGRLAEKLGSVGLPLPGVEIEVREAGGALLPAGAIGELCARGPNVMLGYWNDAELSREVLRDGWLHTGDLAHRDADGFIYIDGRAVEMIKVGAFRVSPQEVEEVLALLPEVEEAAVAALPDEMLGQAIKAVIVPRAGATLDVRAVKAHCRAHLAIYKIPKVVEFAATLPRTSSGKVQRYKLA